MSDLEYRADMIRHHAENIKADDLRAVIAGHQGVISRPEMDLDAAERQLVDALEAIRAVRKQGAPHVVSRAA